MNKIKTFLSDKLTKFSVIAGTALSLAGKVHAQTPVYTMDATVTASVTDLLESLVSTIFSVIPVAIGIVGGLIAPVRLSMLPKELIDIYGQYRG
jgi:hypothetical protein